MNNEEEKKWTKQNELRLITRFVRKHFSFVYCSSSVREKMLRRRFVLDFGFLPLVYFIIFGIDYTTLV